MLPAEGSNAGAPWFINGLAGHSFASNAPAETMMQHAKLANSNELTRMSCFSGTKGLCGGVRVVIVLLLLDEGSCFEMTIRISLVVSSIAFQLI